MATISVDSEGIVIALSVNTTTPHRFERRIAEVGGPWVVRSELTTSFVDFEVADGLVYEYRARSSGGAQTQNEVTAVATLDGTYIHDPRFPLQTLYRFVNDGAGRSRSFSPHREMTRHVEKKLPSVYFGEHVEDSASVELVLDELDREAYETFLRLRRPVIYRDKRGLLIHGVLEGDVTPLDGDGWYSVSLEVTQTSQRREVVS